MGETHDGEALRPDMNLGNNILRLNIESKLMNDFHLVDALTMKGWQRGRWLCSHKSS